MRPFAIPWAATHKHGLREGRAGESAEGSGIVSSKHRCSTLHFEGIKQDLSSVVMKVLEVQRKNLKGPSVTGAWGQSSEACCRKEVWTEAIHCRCLDLLV